LISPALAPSACFRGTPRRKGNAMRMGQFENIPLQVQTVAVAGDEDSTAFAISHFETTFCKKLIFYET
jgi:hypothetical protein